MKRILALGAMVGALTLASPAEAGVSIGVVLRVSDRHDGDYRRGDRYGHGYGREAYRFGYDRGYQEGLKHGSNDGRRHQSFNFRHSREYRDGDRGYRRDYGPKAVYESGFRRGYEAGYERGFERYDGRRGYGRGRDGRIYEEPRRRW